MAKGTPRELTDVRAKAREMLADGEWHDWERVVGRLIRLIPPGRAYRRTESQRVNRQRRRKGEGEEITPRTKNFDESKLIRQGARHIVVSILIGAKEFEHDKESERRRIRMTPEKVAYWGWGKPEDVTPRVREVVGLLVQGYNQKEVSEKLGIALSSVSSHLRHAAQQMGIYSKSNAKGGLQVTVPHELIKRGWVPHLGPMTRLELAYIEHVKKWPGVGMTFRPARMKVDVETLNRARRRLLIRYGVQTFGQLEQDIVDGKIP